MRWTLNLRVMALPLPPSAILQYLAGDVSWGGRSWWPVGFTDKSKAVVMEVDYNPAPRME